MPVARIVEFIGKRPGRQAWTWCPGCDSLHPFTIEAPGGPDGDRLNSGITWEWDGNLESPTFSPSLLCNNPHTRNPAWGACHSFLRAGRWEFLSDSAHRLAGQTVDMVPLPDFYARED